MLTEITILLSAFENVSLLVYFTTFLLAFINRNNVKSYVIEDFINLKSYVTLAHLVELKKH